MIYLLAYLLVWFGCNVGATVGVTLAFTVWYWEGVTLTFGVLIYEVVEETRLELLVVVLKTGNRFVVKTDVPCESKDGANGP